MKCLNRYDVLDVELVTRTSGRNRSGSKMGTRLERMRLESSDAETYGNAHASIKCLEFSQTPESSRIN